MRVNIGIIWTVLKTLNNAMRIIPEMNDPTRQRIWDWLENNEAHPVARMYMQSLEMGAFHTKNPSHLIVDKLGYPQDRYIERKGTVVRLLGCMTYFNRRYTDLIGRFIITEIIERKDGTEK